MLRMIISPTRSGSTALLRCFENNPDVDRVYHQPVKSGFRQDGTFDYGFFSLDAQEPNKIFVAKETVGGFQQPEVDYSPLPAAGGQVSIADRFPSPEDIVKVRPLFLFRDPFQVWNSINRLNVFSAGKSPYFSPFSFFIESLQNVFEFMQYARRVTPHAYCVTLERLASDPKRFIRSICEKWEIPYTDQMVDWTLPYGQRTWYSDETRHRMAHDPRFMHSKELLEKSRTFGYKPSELKGITEAHIQEISEKLMPLYEQIVKISERDFPTSFFGNIRRLFRSF